MAAMPSSEREARLAQLQSVLHERARVVACDANGLVALEKAPGLLSHPNGGAIDRRAVLAAPYDPLRREYAISSQLPPPVLLNRLDQATGGLLLLALDGAVARAVRSAFGNFAVEKTYFAITRWARSFDRERWRDAIREVRGEGVVRVGPGGHLRALTEVFFRTSRQIGPMTLALLELHPITGRTHQLRFQCARRGMPIVGDEIYGDFPSNRISAKFFGGRQLQLHAAKLSLTYQLGVQSHFFSAESAQTGPFLGKFLGQG
jgi:23S rRNA-/tRNA-specific pseudouridylate synthase